MINYNIGKLTLILIIAIKSSLANNKPPTKELYHFLHYGWRFRDIQFYPEDQEKYLSNKPTGLHMAVLDIDFPEQLENTDQNLVKYRAIQCLMNGHVNYLQRKVYRKIVLKLIARDSYLTKDTDKCSNNIKVTLSPPGKIGPPPTYFLSSHYKLFENSVTLNRKDSVIVEFDDVLNDGFLNMELFWINFEIRGRCTKFIEVVLLKPNNSNEMGDADDPEQASEQKASEASAEQSDQAAAAAAKAKP